MLRHLNELLEIIQCLLARFPYETTTKKIYHLDWFQGYKQELIALISNRTWSITATVGDGEVVLDIIDSIIIDIVVVITANPISIIICLWRLR